MTKFDGPEWQPIIVGRKLFCRCRKCGTMVRLDKPIIGSLHVCVDK